MNASEETIEVEVPDDGYICGHEWLHHSVAFSALFERLNLGISAHPEAT